MILSNHGLIDVEKNGLQNNIKYIQTGCASFID